MMKKSEAPTWERGTYSYNTGAPIEDSAWIRCLVPIPKPENYGVPYKLVNGTDVKLMRFRYSSDGTYKVGGQVVPGHSANLIAGAAVGDYYLISLNTTDYSKTELVYMSM